MTEVDVWWARPGAERPGHAGLLTATEAGRRAALRRAADQARFTVATVLVKLAAGRWLGRPAAQVRIDRTCVECGRPHGRPRLPGTNLAVSISHSGDRVLVALAGPAPDGSGGPPVGADVEQLTDLRVEELAGQVLGAGEAARTTTDFFRYWTRKEAVVKATGDGLRMPLAEVVVTPPDQPPALLRYGDRTDLPARLADLDPGDGYAAALAVLAPGPLQIRTHDATGLLAQAVASAASEDR